MIEYVGGLKLGRNPGQSVIIYDSEGTAIRVQVLEIKGKNVRLGIEAPKSYTIDRSKRIPLRQGKLEGATNGN